MFYKIVIFGALIGSEMTPRKAHLEACVRWCKLVEIDAGHHGGPEDRIRRDMQVPRGAAGARGTKRSTGSFVARTRKMVLSRRKTRFWGGQRGEEGPGQGGDAVRRRWSAWVASSDPYHSTLQRKQYQGGICRPLQSVCVARTLIVLHYY